MKKKECALRVKNVSKSFRLPTEQANGIKQAFVNWTKGVKGYKEYKVLKDISFDVEKGDFFGIVGRNGSGKSTLLKIISQIYTPESGEVEVNGTLIPFIELGVGFNPELTGRENIYLNGALLGFSKDEIDTMYDDIVEFAELEEFMDQKLKNYSSGMQVRLAFSIAIKAQGDILVLDEVLAVGDEAFQRKCFEYFADLKKNKKTVILVTHDMGAVQQFCNRAIMIDGGEIVSSGDPMIVAKSYRELFIQDDEVVEKEEVSEGQFESKNENIEVFAKSHLNEDDNNIEINLDFIPKKNMDDCVITVEIFRDNGEPVYRWVTDEKVSHSVNLKKDKKSSLNLTLDNIFPQGRFSVEVGVKKRDRTKNYILVSDATDFQIFNKSSFPGDIRWKPAEKFEIK